MFQLVVRLTIADKKSVFIWPGREEVKNSNRGSSDNTILCKRRPNRSRRLHNTHYRTPASLEHPPCAPRAIAVAAARSSHATTAMARGRPPQRGARAERISPKMLIFCIIAIMAKGHLQKKVAFRHF